MGRRRGGKHFQMRKSHAISLGKIVANKSNNKTLVKRQLKLQCENCINEIVALKPDNKPRVISNVRFYGKVLIIRIPDELPIPGSWLQPPVNLTASANSADGTSQ